MNCLKPSSNIFSLTVPRRYFFCGSFVFFVSCLSHAFASVHCCLVVTCWERADLLALVGDVYCFFVTFPCGILDQVWFLILSFPDLCLLSYFSKAFDTVPRRRLLHKIKHYGVPGRTNRWIDSWLCQQQQRVILDSSSPSSISPVISGIPQETVLGPLMFLLYEPRHVISNNVAF